MTNTIKNAMNKFIQLASAALITLSLGMANAAPTDLGTAPLVSATTGDVLPNLMYILDNSGSMGWDFMPDYVGYNSVPGITDKPIYNNKCKASNGAFSEACSLSDPPYMTSAFNSIYYDPATTYSPGMNADGTEKTSMTSANTTGWTLVPRDAYNIQSTAKDRLIPNTALATAGYLDKVWCNAAPASIADRYNPAICNKNSQYIYPNASFSNGPNTIYGHPYYYTVSAGKYCTDKFLTSCITATAPTATHTFPAKLRWCTDSTYSNCQSKYLETTPTYKFAEWAGVVTGSSATGTIRIDAQSPANSPAASPSAMSITNITVNGISIISTPTSGLTISDTSILANRAALATSVKNAINAFVPTLASGNTDFWATCVGGTTCTGDLVTLFPVDRATSNPISAAFSGAIEVTTSADVVVSVAGAKAVGSITFTRARNSLSMTVSVNTNGGAGPSVPITGTVTAPSSDNTTTFANTVRAAINALSATSGYSATSSGGTVTITAASVGASKNGPIFTSIGGASVGGGSDIRYNTSPLAGGTGATSKTYTLPVTAVDFTGGAPSVNTFNRVDIEPATTSYPKAASRTDCAGATTCTYNEEMTNFANWYSYYRTRMQMMKTSTSRAFRTIDTRFRVGFITISSQSSYYLPIAPFATGQKASWYNKLVSVNPANSTPLRSALSMVGRIYAGKNPVSGFTADPVQYSCQQNFAILTTDGYWNTDANSDVKTVTGGALTSEPAASACPSGNCDGAGTSRPMYEGTTASFSTLSDTAKYYYDTDLRTTALGNCTGSTRPNGTTGDVCENNVFVTATDNNIKQHMTTFTLGLGVDASLTYTTDYKTATSGDFFELTQGTRNWPVPVADSQTAVDDLWHAAVNGQGSYFSAKNPTQLTTSLAEALQSIKAKVGAGAAAATSTLNPVAGDNFSYVASYTSQKWIGNLEARTVNIDTGKVSEDATWCLENVVQDTCSSPGVIEAVASGSSTQYFCKTGGATASTCTAPGVLSGTDCRVEVATACTGTLQSKVGASTDTRSIFMNVGGVLGAFNAANITTVGENTNFENSFLKVNLSQASIDFDEISTTATAKQNLMTKATLVSYLRGNTGYENRSANLVGTIDNRIYRFREAVTGDLVDSTPIFVGAPKANFTDPGYGTIATIGSFKETHKARQGTVYIGANDGMLHAINATNGQERWAYVPTMVMSNMYKLADKNYANAHNYFVNGDIVANDICTANCSSSATAVWKTILVAGLNGGGKGFFALDITNPDLPELLWEFDASDDNDVGFSYGNPVITKKADGTWVVLLTSGYNNLTGTNPGKGFLYVVNAATGALLSGGKYATGAGNASTPSGLADVNAYVTDASLNNTALYVYGGDLLGNVWRFDINSASSATNPFKIAVLKDPSGTVQPITVRPELAEASGKRVLYVGTGRYLGLNDLTDTQQQTIYAITDEGTTTLDNPRNSSLMVKQILTASGTAATRTIASPNPVNLASGRGWYIDFLDTGERQNVPAQLVFGTLLLPSTVPTNSLCSPGGYGWLNFLDYRTGAAVGGTLVSTKTNAPIVGINVFYIKGKPVVNIVTADNPTPQFPAVQPQFTGGSESGFTNHRVIWRELIDEQ